jgi:hypothetical protein
VKLYQVANAMAQRLGLEIKPSGFSSDFDQPSIEIIRRVEKHTMTTPDRLYSLIQAVNYVVDAGVPGDIVECGVWRGGSMMAAALSLIQRQRCDIDLYLFDTFEGMSEPSEKDVDYRGNSASARLATESLSTSSHLWAYATLDEVKRNMCSTNYDPARVHFVPGKVEDTLPQQAPAEIALLRLDTDWYESTRHELIHLYPRLAKGGVLILDDYGHWEGARLAFDEFARENGLHILLNRIDNSGRIAVKID